MLEARERCREVPPLREGRAHREGVPCAPRGVPLLLQLREGEPRVRGVPRAQGRHQLQGVQELRRDGPLCVGVHPPQARGQEALPCLREVRPHPGGLPLRHGRRGGRRGEEACRDPQEG